MTFHHTSIIICKSSVPNQAQTVSKVCGMNRSLLEEVCQQQGILRGTIFRPMTGSCRSSGRTTLQRFRTKMSFCRTSIPSCNEEDEERVGGGTEPGKASVFGTSLWWVEFGLCCNVYSIERQHSLDNLFPRCGIGYYHLSKFLLMVAILNRRLLLQREGYGGSAISVINPDIVVMQQCMIMRTSLTTQTLEERW